MSESKIELKGFDDFFGRLKNSTTKFEKLKDDAIKKTALQIRSRVVDGISSQRWKSKWPALSENYSAFKLLNKGSSLMLVSGIRSRFRKRTKDKVSMKKQLPGNYRNSFEIKKNENAIWSVGSNYPQARALELGYPKKKLPARPHLQFAVEESADDLQKNVLDALKRSFT